MAKRQRRRRLERRQEHAKNRGWRTHHSVLTGAALTAGGMLGIAQPALADDSPVKSPADDGDATCQDVVAGDCTLRDAVSDANADSNCSVIYFASYVTGTIAVGSSIDVNYPTYIFGAVSSTLTI